MGVTYQWLAWSRASTKETRQMKSSLSNITESMLVLSTCLFLCLAPNSSYGAEKLRVAYATITAAFAIPWVAKEAGIFQRHGLDVELVYIASGPRSVQTLVAGSVDVAALGGASGIDARLAGADTVYVAVPVNRVLVFTVAAPGIQRVEDLRGKVIGATRVGTLTDFFTRLFLRQAGLVPDRDVIIRGTGGLPENLAALKAGQIQASTFGFPAVLLAQAAGFHVLVDYSKLGFRYPLSAVVVTQNLIRTRRPVVRSFLEAYMEGIYRFRADPAFAMEVIGKYTHTSDRKILEESQRVYAAAFQRVPYPDPEDMKLALSQVSENNPRARGADPREFIDPRLIREIEASGFIERLYGEKGR